MSEHYEAVRKWSPHKFPELGAKFEYQSAEYEVLGANPAGNKMRARKQDDGKVYLFEVGNMRKYKGLRYVDNT